MTTAPEKLRAWINKNELSDAEVSRRLGVSKASVCDWLRGEKTPGYSNARAISKLTRRAVRIADWYAPE